MSYRIDFSVDFRRNTFGGLFIALEGLDGSGKSVQIPRLKKYFTDQGKEVALAHAPGKDQGILGTINKQLLEKKISIPRYAYQYLFTANYIIQMEEVIIPMLTRGGVVISDRFCGWSAVAYGIWEQDEKKYDITLARSILAAHGVLTKSYQFVVPDKTFYLNVSLDTAMTRLGKKTEQRDLYEDRGILRAVKNGYNWLIKEFTDEFTTIDAEKSIADVTEDMIKQIEFVSSSKYQVLSTNKSIKHNT